MRRELGGECFQPCLGLLRARHSLSKILFRSMEGNTVGKQCCKVAPWCAYSAVKGFGVFVLGVISLGSPLSALDPFRRLVQSCTIQYPLPIELALEARTSNLP